MQSMQSVTYVVGPDGEKMTRSDLPPPDTRRWVPRRKARVVAAVEGGLITEEEAFERYDITAEEFDGWKSGITRFGLKGLCVTRINQVRSTLE